MLHQTCQQLCLRHLAAVLLAAGVSCLVASWCACVEVDMPLAPAAAAAVAAVLTDGYFLCVPAAAAYCSFVLCITQQPPEQVQSPLVTLAVMCGGLCWLWLRPPPFSEGEWGAGDCCCVKDCMLKPSAAGDQPCVCLAGAGADTGLGGRSLFVCVGWVCMVA